ncbi:unnamed protein product [Clonostachys solani]|uniref:GPI anchored protein n=1 Tax=Clonostachys solani TaxID=160281 RepID=A0A9N9W4J1_9HYPO|nr:unnamed protein product [Clonostachys solani]
MRLTNIILAALPAFVFAEGDEATTTLTSTLTRTKYITLSAADVSATTPNATTTTSATTTPGSSSSSSTGLTTLTSASATGSGSSQPTTTDQGGAASALDVTRIAYAGALGAIVVALM